VSYSSCVDICIFFHAVPLLKDLYKQITLKYAPHWKEIGLLLDLNHSQLEIINADNPNSVKSCCNKMLAEWLRVDIHASWKKLFAAIDSIVVLDDQTITSQGIYIVIAIISCCFF